MSLNSSAHGARSGLPHLLPSRNAATKVWSRQPLLDVVIVVLLEAVVGRTPAALASVPSILALGLTSTAATLGVGWIACLRLVSRLDGMPVPGFGRGFPRNAGKALARIAVQGLLLAVTTIVLGVSAHFEWSATLSLVLPAVLLTVLGYVRCVQMLRPLIRVVLL